jgi:hypothetical protein
MATPDQIPTDLTLEIGENLPPARFMAAAKAFFGYVDECASAVQGDGERVDWVVRIREGSHLIGVDPAVRAARPAMLAAIYNKAQSGLEMLASGDVKLSGLSEGAMRHLRVLGEMTDGTHGKPVPVKLWVRRKPVSIVPEVSHSIREDTKAAYNDYGTLEGRLRAIQDEGTLRLMLRDDMFGVTTRAYVSDDLLPAAFDNFRKRVEVSGLIHYRRNGTPISIEVSRIDPLPDDSELPSADDVRGLLRATG